jgi:hypothetical protein
MGSIGMLAQGCLFDEDRQGESSRRNRSRKHGEGDQPLGPGVGLALVELQAEVDQWPRL